MTSDDNGYVDGEYKSVLPDQLGPWTQAESIRYEVAEDLLGSLIADCSARIYNAKRADPPDREAIQRWDREQAEWCRRRKELAWASTEEIEEVIKTYAPIARVRYAEELQSDRDLRASRRS